MITLRLLGAVEVRNAGGTGVDELQKRPHRLALLSYLAAVQPYGFHRRDTLLGLFWGDTTQGKARKALNQALFVVRQELGSDTILSRGDAEVALNDQMCSVDVRVFDELMRAGDHASALQTYLGEFLEGFYIPRAAEFERWADQERTRLRQQAIRAAFALSEQHQAAGEYLAAVERVRWATRIAPADETVFRKLVLLLDGHGDRASAIREYEAFLQRLSDDYGIDPSPETRAVMDRIRSRVAPAASPAPAPAAAAAGPPPSAPMAAVEQADGQRLQRRLELALHDRYRIDRPIGFGGMAVVFLAHDLRLDRRVAIKVLRPELAASIGVERFLQEIRIEASLDHPNIIPIFDAGEADGLPYYAMPYLEGESLRARLQRERQLAVEEAIAIAVQVAQALDAAHQQGVIHRDITPANILLADGKAVVSDFGVARALTEAGAARLTVTGVAIGTPGYMSPEQATAEEVDGRSDQYSLACVLYEMLTGEMVFTGPTARAIIAKHVTWPPPGVRTLRSEVPEHVERAILKALGKVPADRFPSAERFARTLTGMDPATPTSGSRPTAVAAAASWTWQWLRAHPAAAVAAAGVLAVAVALGARATRGSHLRARDWILVADFQGPQDDPGLATAVRELVTTELNQSRFVSTVPRQQLNSVMRLAGVPETTHVDAELARQLAYRTAVRAIVAGAVQPIGQGRYSVAIHVVSAEDGRDLHSVAESAADHDLVTVTGRLARELRRGLGERRGVIEATLPLRQAATPSFPAYKKYVEGLGTTQRGDVVGGNQLLRQALALDTAFASAWAAIGANYLGARQLDSAQAAFLRALALPGRLTDAQQYRLQGDMAYAIRHDVPAAVRWYDLYLAEFPRTVGGRNNRALYLSGVGRYQDAVDDLRAAIAANPFGPGQVQISLFNLTAMLVALGRVPEAQNAAADLGPPLRSGADILIAVAEDRWPAVERLGAAVDSLPAAPPFVRLLGATGRASALAAQGRLEAAAQLLRARRDAASGTTARWYERAGLLLDLAGQRPVATPEWREPPDTAPPGRVTHALRAAMAGDTASARRQLARLDASSDQARAAVGLGADLAQAWIAATAGRWTEVTSRLRAAAAAGEHDATVLDRASSIEIRWLVARAYEALGQLDSARSYLGNAVASERVPAGHLVLRGLVLLHAHERLARWSLALGDTAAAVTHWRFLIQSATAPDPGLVPLLQSATRSLNALAGGR